MLPCSLWVFQLFSLCRYPLGAECWHPHKLCTSLYKYMRRIVLCYKWHVIFSAWSPVVWGVDGRLWCMQAHSRQSTGCCRGTTYVHTLPSPPSHTHTRPHNHYMTYRVYLCYLCCYEQPCHSHGSVGVMYTQNWSLWEVGMLWTIGVVVATPMLQMIAGK